MKTRALRRSLFAIPLALAVSVAAEDPPSMPALDSLDQLGALPLNLPLLPSGGWRRTSSAVWDGDGRLRGPLDLPDLPNIHPLPVAQGLAASRVNRGFASAVGVPAIGAIFALDKALNPHKAFTRDVVRADPRSLSEQAAQMQKDIRDRFLLEDGKLFLYQKPMSMGDMNIWQGAYTTMAILEYTWEEGHSSPEAPESLQYAEKAFDGLAMMYKKGLPLVRGVLPLGVSNSSEKDRFHHQDATHQWQEDASLDSTSGWLLGVIMAERYLPSRREQASKLLKSFADDIMANGFQLKNSDGSKTRFGNLGHGLMPSPQGVLMSIAALSQAAQDYPDQSYNDALDKFAKQKKDVWAAYAGEPALWKNNTTNDNMGMLALTAGLLTEQDPDRWLNFAKGMVRLAKAYEKSGNSFWIYLTYWALEQRPDLLMMNSDDKDVSDWMSRRARLLALAGKPMYEFQYPGCKLAYEAHNSVARDLDFVEWPVKGKKTLAQPLPLCDGHDPKNKHCRPAADFVWQRDQWSMDDWIGFKDKPAFEFTGMDFLFAYYLGLHDGAIQPGE